MRHAIIIEDDKDLREGLEFSLANKDVKCIAPNKYTYYTRRLLYELVAASKTVSVWIDK